MEQKLMEKWKEKIKSIEFIHYFSSYEVEIYSDILRDRLDVLNGTIHELSEKVFNVSAEVFFGFLLGLNSLYKLDVDNLKESSYIDIKINFKDIYTILNDKDYLQLLKIDLWNTIPEKTTTLRVGFLRTKRFTQELVLEGNTKTLFEIAKDYDVELFFFTPEDINFKSKIITGKYLKNGIIIEKDTIYPDVTDNIILGKNLRYASEELSTYGKITRHNPPYNLPMGKYNDIEMLRKEGTFKELIIPSSKMEKFDDIISNLNKFNNEIIIKPNSSSGGKGVIKLYKKDNTYYLIENRKKIKLSYIELQDYFIKNLSETEHVIQSFIVSKTLKGEPYDIRIYAKRGGDGKFVIRCYPRIGSSKGVVSNISSGARSMELNKFLQMQFGKQYKDVLDKLNELAEIFPHYYQSFFPKKLFSVGIDVGIQKINKSFNFYIFEVSHNVIGATQIPMIDAKTSLGYYKYVYNNSVE